MSDPEAPLTPDLRLLTAEIVAAYVAHNSMQPAGMPEVIASVHAALTSLVTGVSKATSETVEPATPAQIRRSITPDALISFFDGKPYKTLRRHLTGHGLDADSYRRRFGLPADYPMVAANYAALRSELAKQLGLGRTQRNADEPAASVESTITPVKQLDLNHPT